jgi:hypothetical protein
LTTYNVIFKTEVVAYPDRDPKNNMRFVVTNLKRTPKNVYKFYCQRGDAENPIKELKNDLAMDRTNCTRFLANQFRVLLTAASYVLMQEIQRKVRQSDCADAQVGMLRNRLLKLAVRVEVSVRRVVIHMAKQFPSQPAWLRVALARVDTFRNRKRSLFKEIDRPVGEVRLQCDTSVSRVHFVSIIHRPLGQLTPNRRGHRRITHRNVNPRLPLDLIGVFTNNTG